MKKLICSLILASSGLFITALVPTKADAISLTLTPVGSLERKPGDVITFELLLDPMGSKIWFQDWGSYSFDREELGYALNESSITGTKGYFRMTPNTLLSGPEVVAKLPLTVREGVKKDGMNDFFVRDARYTTYDPVLGEIVEKRVNTKATKTDVVPFSEPVPEPTTIFGSVIALGVGGWLKRKKSNQQHKTTAQR